MWVAKSPGVRLTHGGTAEKHGFFREAISVRKSLSCFTSEIRAWSMALGSTGCRDTTERLNARGKTGVSVPYAGLVEAVSAERISAG